MVEKPELIRVVYNVENPQEGSYLRTYKRIIKEEE